LHAANETNSDRWLRELHDRSLAVRRDGADNVGNAGVQARDTTPRLLEMLASETDPGVRDSVVRAVGLVSKGVSGAPQALARVLHEDPTTGVRRRAAEALGELAEAPDVALPALGSALTDLEIEVRQAAAEALGAYKTSAGQVVPLLMQALPDRGTAAVAVLALGRLGPAAAPAVPALRRLAAVKDTDAGTRRQAVQSLGLIGINAQAATPECLQLLKEEDPRMRLEAAIALLSFGREAGAALQALNAALAFTLGDATRGDAETRSAVVSRAAWAAGQHAALADGETLARLAVAAEDRDRDIRRYAAQAYDTVLAALVDQRRFDTLDSLVAARDFLEHSSVERIRNRSRSIAAAVAELERLQPLTVRVQRNAGRVAAAAVALMVLAALVFRRVWCKAPQVFLSYRRSDSVVWCGRLYDRLETMLGKGRTFRDIDSLEPGVRFEQRLRERVAACDAFVALIGPGWLDAAAVEGHRRIDQPADYVRQEIEMAIAQGKPLFPVLVDGARMPTAAELPPTLSALTAANAAPLTDTHFSADVAKLVKAMRAATRR
jgi:hypothetical protein